MLIILHNNLKDIINWSIMTSFNKLNQTLALFQIQRDEGTQEDIPSNIDIL